MRYKNATVSETASIMGDVAIGTGSIVRSGVHLGEGVRVGKQCDIGAESWLTNGSILEDGVVVGPKVWLGARVLVLDGAIICRDLVTTHSKNAREIGHKSSIGAGVELHPEAGIGEGMIIPTQASIITIEYFGEKNRAVGAHGSDDGPRFTVGCRRSIPFVELQDRVTADETSTPESRASYLPYLGIFNAIGVQVQKAYDDAASYVAEIKAMRESLGI